MTENPLRDALGHYRVYVYAVVFVLALAWTAYQTADGNVLEAIGGFIVLLQSALAGSNVNTPDV